MFVGATYQVCRREADAPSPRHHVACYSEAGPHLHEKSLQLQHVGCQAAVALRVPQRQCGQLQRRVAAGGEAEVERVAGGVERGVYSVAGVLTPHEGEVGHVEAAHGMGQADGDVEVGEALPL
jgi:hypothetical protein